MPRFFTDTHLGLRRKSHTTLAGQARLSQTLYDQAMACVEGRDDSFMLGDLFDEYSNNEAVIEQGADVARRCRLVLGGNHDIRNRADVVSSLQLLASVTSHNGCHFGLPNLSDPEAYDDGVGVMTIGNNWAVSFVPHQMSQADFIAALDAACEVPTGSGIGNILLLHCNYDTDFGQITDDGATLNLSREHAEKLLETFDYILLGHEHEPKEDFDGRLKVLGNTFPLSFGEIADRFYYEFDTETGTFQTVQIFEAESSSIQIDVCDFMIHSADEEWLRLLKYQFIDVQGTLPAADYPELGRRLVKLWKLAPNLLMCRNGVRMEVMMTNSDAAPDDTSSAAKRTIPEIITDELAGGELATLFAELSAEEAAAGPSA